MRVAFFTSGRHWVAITSVIKGGKVALNLPFAIIYLFVIEVKKRYGLLQGKKMLLSHVAV